MSDEAHATAVVTAINAQLPEARRAYEVDDLPSPRPAEYVEVTVSRRAGAEPRFVGRTGRTGWRVTTRPVSSTSAKNVRLMQADVVAALDGVNLSIGGEFTTPTQFETADPVAPDDNWFSALTAWTYAL